MRYITAMALALLLPTTLHAEPAPLSYKDASGKNPRVSMVVRPNADGTLPVASYIGADGKRYAPLVQAVICLEVDGAPQLCPTSGTPDLSQYITTTTANSTYATIASLEAYKTSVSTTYETIAGLKSTLDAERGSVTGDISASGSSLTLTLGTSSLQLVMSYASAGVGSLSAVATTGSLTPVDIYETAAWGTTPFKGFTLDSGTITTTATMVDSTFYLTSNVWGTYHVGVGGHLYVVDIFGAGKRATMSWRKLS